MPREDMFANLSPYNKWLVFKSDTAQGLADILNDIRTPHKVHFVISERGRFYAYCTGDIRVKEMGMKPGKTKKVKKTITRKIKES